VDEFYQQQEISHGASGENQACSPLMTALQMEDEENPPDRKFLLLI